MSHNSDAEIAESNNNRETLLLKRMEIVDTFLAEVAPHIETRIVDGYLRHWWHCEQDILYVYRAARLASQIMFGDMSISIDGGKAVCWECYQADSRRTSWPNCDHKVVWV